MSKEGLTSVPLSKSQRRAANKKSHGPHVERVICSICGQQANAQPGTTHAYCDGMPPGYFDRAPQLRGRMHGNRKGEWVTMADFELAKVEFNKLRQAIAFFTMLHNLIPPEAKVNNGGNDQGDSDQITNKGHQGHRKAPQVEHGRLSDRTKVDKARHHISKAA
jgi:hypothetical protein